MEYVVLYIDFERLSAAEADDFAAAAEALGFDVDELPPPMGVDPEIVVLVSSALGAMLGVLAEKTGESAGERLWGLLRRVLPLGRGGPEEEAAIADRTTRVTFVFDTAAMEAGEAVAREMCALSERISAIPDGTVLRWVPALQKWQAEDG
ncbi:hypothetical protein ACTMTI_24435 [Nonomuraea sp. H19]|uniref:hypothetical protein n=1 Tax=Nonomuraea sp. H19 TaxID=3452206 RepID=UPI003F8AB19B